MQAQKIIKLRASPEKLAAIFSKPPADPRHANAAIANNPADGLPSSAINRTDAPKDSREELPSESLDFVDAQTVDTSEGEVVEPRALSIKPQPHLRRIVTLKVRPDKLADILIEHPKRNRKRYIRRRRRRGLPSPPQSFTRPSTGRPEAVFPPFRVHRAQLEGPAFPRELPTPLAYQNAPTPPSHAVKCLDDTSGTGIEMSDSANNNKPAAGAKDDGGLPFYESQRRHLKELLEKRRKLADKVARDEEVIEQKETEYLESTPAGNILTGFDNYTKGTTQAAAAQRRKAGALDQHRVFSRSSISYNPNAVVPESSATTPGSSHAPTPVSSTFGTNQPTPTSAGPSGSRTVTVSRDRKKKGAAAAAEAGDSESDAKEIKKVRTNFGASRK